MEVEPSITPETLLHHHLQLVKTSEFQFFEMDKTQKDS